MTATRDYDRIRSALASPADIAATSARLASAQASARAAMARMEERADAADAERAQLAAAGWGAVFTASPQWRNRAGYTCQPVQLDGYLEERAAAVPLAPGAAAGGIGPVASRCGTIPATPGDVALLRWQGPLLPGAPQVPEELKQAAGDAPTLEAVTAPYVGAWVPCTRAVLEDHAALASVIDGRLRRALALSLDNELVDLMAADADIPPAGSVLAAVGSLSAGGYGGGPDADREP